MNPDEIVDGYERALIGGVMWANSVKIPPLRPEEFFLEKHRLIWRHVLDCVGAAVPPALPMLTERCRQAGDDQVIGAVYLTQCFEEGTWAVPIHLEGYAQKIREAATSRAMRSFGQELSDQGLTRDEVEARLAAMPRSGLARTRDIGTLWAEVQRGWSAGSVRLGVPALDAMLGRLYPGDLVVIGGRPSHGKTSMLASIALKVAGEDGISVFACSIESSAAGLLRRLIGAQAAVRLTALRSGALGPTDFSLADETAAWLATLPLTLRDVADLGSKRADRLLAIFQADPSAVVMLDHLQEVATEGESRALALGQFVGALKELALRDQKIVILAAQLHRAGAEEPHLAALKESGGIEEKADIVLLLDYVAKRNPERRTDELDVLVAKNRDGGTGTVTLRFAPMIGKVG